MNANQTPDDECRCSACGGDTYVVELTRCHGCNNEFYTFEQSRAASAAHTKERPARIKNVLDAIEERWPT